MVYELGNIWTKYGKCYGQGGVNMKSYAIYDKSLEWKKPIGYLFYFDKAKTFIIELSEELDEWEAPLLFQGLVNKGIYTVPADISLMWVKERIIPSGRQNIGMILKNHKLKEYSEMAFLALNKGRCIQDECYIVQITEEEIPQDIKERMSRNMAECFTTEDGGLLCMFKDDVVMKVDFERLTEKYKKLLYILNVKEWRENVKITAGGYSVLFNDTVEILSSDLRKIGVTLPLSTIDFYNFIQRNIVSTSAVCEMLQCSRQNLAYMVKEEKIQPIISGTKENLYTKGQVEGYKIFEK